MNESRCQICGSDKHLARYGDCRPVPAWIDRLPDVWKVTKAVWALIVMVLTPILMLSSFYLLSRGDVPGATWALVMVTVIRLPETWEFHS